MEEKSNTFLKNPAQVKKFDLFLIKDFPFLKNLEKSPRDNET